MRCLALARLVSVDETESWASSEAVRHSMQANRSRDTGPEMAVRRLLFSRGLRYRVAYHPLPDHKRTTVDIAFPRLKIVVLIDGCFWHGCPDHYSLPRTHSDYWQAKIDRNSTRDTTTNRELAAAGWQVLRFWSHDKPEEVARAVESAVRQARGS